MKIQYAVIKRNGFNGLLINIVGVFDSIEDANEHGEHCSETTGRIQDVYYEVEIVKS
jgi:hypothetical protein